MQVRYRQESRLNLHIGAENIAASTSSKATLLPCMGALDVLYMRMEENAEKNRIGRVSCGLHA